MLGAIWSSPVTEYCRGTILRNSHSGWEILALPFNKFFNQSEGHCPIHKEEDFNSSIDDLFVYEKVDGSCILTWYDPYLNIWRVSTLGSISTKNISDSNITFADLFWLTVNRNVQIILDKNYSYIFELCSVYNRVVTKYPTDRVYLLGVRNKITGLSDNKFQEFVKLFNEYSKTSLINVNFPYKSKLKDLSLNDLKETLSWVESQASDFGKYGEYPEGFVLYKGETPICKIKNSAYLLLHSSLSDPACTRKAVINCFFQGTIDDIYSALPDKYKESVEKLKKNHNEIKENIKTACNLLRQNSFQTRKDYALYILNNQNQIFKQFKSFFFAFQKEACDSNIDIREIFSNWIIENYSNFDELWKKVAFE
jgi:hypothetical protein